MGSSYSSHTNLGSDCASFDAGATGTRARWGDSFEVSMCNDFKENDHTEFWGVTYTAGQKKHNCGFQLRATRDINGVQSIYFGIRDSADNSAEFSLEITRVGRDGLSGGIIGIRSCGAPKSFTRAKNDYSIETTIVSYGNCSHREGLFVLEKKKKVNSDNAYMVTLAHYYVNKELALSVVAKIRRKKENGFDVEVEGPFKHPSADLLKVLVKTCRTGIWSPAACSHCNGAKANTVTRTGEPNSSLKPQSHNQSHDHEVSQIVKHEIFSSNVREQHNMGLINSSGYTSGSLNNSIICIKCNLTL
ncbi:uncharacterized protein LOC133290722 [Gastrolobium bilobum]|uniref:uncharacterized protein LOC133290722 n=1 Tax=Gastrolobium bilobum TaxID=150636 RepID=UPI002AB1A7E6|nr:uncharacterized protein LOC133290722 [Gastrolobium bilobum]